MTPPSLGRLQAVAFVLVRHGFGEIVSRIGLLRSAAWSPSPSMEMDAAAASRERVGRRIARVLADLGPTYIKLGQLLATREDLLPPEVTTALRELHSAAPPMKPRVVKRLLEDALGEPTGDAFAWFDPTPLAAASIGQVHRARLHSGEQVVLKVQRPDLHRTVKGDLALMRTLAALLAQTVPEIAAYDPVALLDAFERSMTAELDFRVEADNARRLALLLASAPEVRVPRIYAARPTLLVMEYVPGHALASLQEARRRRARGLVVRAFVRQILEHGVFHADPHPGNLMVDDEGRIVLLDLGAVDEIDARTRDGLVRVVLAMALHQPRALGYAVTALARGGPPPRLDRARLEGELALLVTDTASGVDGAKLVGRIVAISRTHALRMPPSLVGLARALAILDGVVRTLDPTADPVADVRREMARAALREAWRRTRMLAITIVAWIVTTLARGARRAASSLVGRGPAQLTARVGRESMAD